MDDRFFRRGDLFFLPSGKYDAGKTDKVSVETGVE